MKDNVETIEFDAVADVPFEEAGRPVDLSSVAEREIVDHDDLVSSAEKRVDEVRADEARAARDGRPHW